MGRKQTLNVFVQALEGSRVVVELRSDTIIRGLLQQVDSEMNLTLVDVSCRPLEGTARELEFLYVKGRHVRFIHFPGAVNAATLVEDKRALARQAALAHAAAHHPPRALPKGRPAPAAVAAGAGEGAGNAGA